MKNISKNFYAEENLFKILKSELKISGKELKNLTKNNSIHINGKLYSLNSNLEDYKFFNEDYFIIKKGKRVMKVIKVN